MKVALNKKINSGSFFTILLILVWSRDILLPYARAILLKIPYISYIVDAFIVTVFIVFVVFSMPHFIRKLKYYDIIAFAGFAIVYLACSLWGSSAEYLTQNALETLLVIVPFYFVGRAIDTEKHFNYLYIVSIVTIFIRCADLLVNARDELYYVNGAMDAAYKLLPHVLLALYGVLSRREIFGVLASVFGCVSIISFGSRGPVMLVLGFVVCYFVFFGKFKRPALSYILFGVLTLSVVIFYEDIIQILYDVSSQLGMSVRVYEKLLEGSYFVSDGRNVIAIQLFAAILQQPVWGYGFAGDRAFVDSYAHNIVLELWVSFGVVFGTLVFVGLLYIFVRGFLKAKNNREKGIIILLLCCGFLKLFMSSSYLLEPLFFMSIGLCLSTIVQKKKCVSGDK